MQVTQQQQQQMQQVPRKHDNKYIGYVLVHVRKSHQQLHYNNCTATITLHILLQVHRKKEEEQIATTQVKAHPCPLDTLTPLLIELRLMFGCDFITLTNM